MGNIDISLFHCQKYKKNSYLQKNAEKQVGYRSAESVRHDVMEEIRYSKQNSMVAANTWSRLIRFLSSDNKIYYGDAGSSSNVNLVKKARVLEGNPFGDYRLTDEKPVIKLLAPLDWQDIRTIRCLGLNFFKHAAESGAKPPKFPVIFHKPVTSITGPTSDVTVPPIAQTAGAVDYEVELVAVIGKQVDHPVTPTEALQYVAGYTTGDDLSQREWQLKLGGGQWNYSKGFDGWAPIGPCIASPETLGDVTKKRLTCKVNGELRQSELAGDMIFSVGDAIAFLSQSGTLLPGDLIFMGTPSGVGMGFKPPKWVKDGDEIECAIEGIGSITNKIKWTSYRAKL